MSFVTTQPDVVLGAASNLAGLGDAIATPNAAAATPTTALAPAAAQFCRHGTTYQRISAQAAEVHEQLVGALRSGAGAYALTEAANAAAAD